MAFAVPLSKVPNRIGLAINHVYELGGKSHRLSFVHQSRNLFKTMSVTFALAKKRQVAWVAEKLLAKSDGIAGPAAAAVAAAELCCMWAFTS